MLRQKIELQFKNVRIYSNCPDGKVHRETQFDPLDINTFLWLSEDGYFNISR